MKRILFLLALLIACITTNAKTAHSFEIKGGKFIYDGKPTMIYSGEMHFARVPHQYWRHRLQMMKAMGLNTVATYVFWNFHETAPGKWDWTTDEHNIRKFIKTAEEEGMFVILRPGPYACAEGEFGGYPWWLQKQEGLVLRSYNEPFLAETNKYIRQLVAQVSDLQVTKGGPVIMIQAENEFGSYVAQRPDIPLEEHRRYSAAICRQLLDAGVEVPLFTSDGSWLFEGGSVPGALPTANGEGDIDNLKKVVNEYHNGEGPYMVAEFYPGWLDHWNEPFQRVSTESIVNQTRKYLENDVCFNIYMVHGGTNFAFWSGANYTNDNNIQPDLTSYDYDAPISEAGWATEKYLALRAEMQKHLRSQLPAVPAKNPVITIPDIQLPATADVLSWLHSQKPVESDRPMTFEDLDQGYGYVLYSRHFNQPISGIMRVPGIADYATVYVDGKRIGELNRLIECDSIAIDLPFNSTLEILVENFGRINYGARIISNLKGITLPITIDGKEISGEWKHYKMPLAEQPDMAQLPADYKPGCPVFYHGTFTLDTVGDTFLDMSAFGKGIVFVNGHNLGRYWYVGPQQTLYLPGCWLRKGQNEIVILDQLNDSRLPSVSGVETPVLEQQRPLRTAVNSQQSTVNSQQSILETLSKTVAELQQQVADLRKQVDALQQQLNTPKRKTKK